MVESADSVEPYCCVGFKQLLRVVFVMMDNSCMLSICIE